MEHLVFYSILGIYTAALVYITIYCLFQLHLLFKYKRAQWSRIPTVVPDVAPDEWPVVTVQLPIYNEFYVVERLIDNIILLDYPREKLEIQVLDDSTDETVAVVARKVQEYRQQGFDIRQIRRSDRTGYKAGALKEGMAAARGDYIAIFDADFLPRPHFLKKTIPFFREERVGVVQTRWEHLNEDYSLITRLQAIQLNVHFTVEQQGRHAGQYLLQFNGTAGVWRKSTIEDAGGWEADTLTEDLDLSIRAQLKGWKIRYLENIGSPAELPAEMLGLKSQQFRWMKGGAETARKILPMVWRSSISLGKKVHATVHLMASTVFVFVFIVGFFSVPLLFIMTEIGFDPGLFTGFLIGWLSIVAVYYVANVESSRAQEPYVRRIVKFLLMFPLFLALSMGLSLHNTVAVFQGYVGRKSPFVRTPKFNILGIRENLSAKKYLGEKLPWTTVFEGLMTLYFLGGVAAGIWLENQTFLFFHLLLTFGYGTIFYFTVRHLSPKR